MERLRGRGGCVEILPGGFGADDWGVGGSCDTVDCLFGEVVGEGE